MIGLWFFRIMIGAVTALSLAAALVYPAMLLVAAGFAFVWYRVERRERGRPVRRTRWADMTASQRAWRVVPAVMALFLMAGLLPREDEADSADRLAAETAPAPQMTAEEREVRAFEARHGPAPQRGLGGDYIEIRYFLRDIAHDPKSIKIDRCTPLQRTDEGWMTVCRWRGANAFGTQRLSEDVFIVSGGRVQMIDL